MSPKTLYPSGILTEPGPGVTKGKNNDLPMEGPHTGECWFSFGAAVDLRTEIKPAVALVRLRVHTLGRVLQHSRCEGKGPGSEFG